MTTQAASLTSSLAGYLETIFELIRDRKLARVRDIAGARGVKPGSVSPAMKRLASMGLIQYVRHEYVDLTPAGVEHARAIHARHQLLTRLFGDVLGLDPDEADENARAMEHNLSFEAMDRLVRFFEFVQVCPEGKSIMEMFRQCDIAPDGACACPSGGPNANEMATRVSDLAPGQIGTVVHVNGSGAIRQRLLDMGILPNVVIEVERLAPAGDPLWIKLEGFQLSLRRAEADSVLVVSG